MAKCGFTNLYDSRTCVDGEKRLGGTKRKCI